MAALTFAFFVGFLLAVAWLVPALICFFFPTMRRSTGRILTLYPAVIAGLVVGQFLLEALFRESFQARGDSPAQVAELMFASAISWLYVPIVKLFMARKRVGELDKFLKFIEILFWIPASLVGLFVFGNFFLAFGYLLFQKGQENFDPKLLWIFGRYLIVFAPPIGIRILIKRLGTKQKKSFPEPVKVNQG